MKPQEWRQKLGDCVRELFLSPEMQHFYSIPMSTDRARIYLLQLSLYVRQRRNFWPQVAANCPEFEVKQRIMEHEHEELVAPELVLERRIFIGVDGDAGAEFVESFRRACAGGENERRDYDNGARTAAMRECSRHFSDTFACHDDETPPTAGNVYRALSSAAIARRV